MSTRRPLLAFVAAAVAFGLAGPSTAAPAERQPASLTLTILHDNDLHGHLLPFAYNETARRNVEEPSRGGAARRATLIRRLRASIHNPTFVVDSGDTTTRGPLTTTYEGIADIEAMNAVGYDLGALGNNEFKLKDGVDATDAGGAQAALLLFLKHSRFPWVCANAVDQKGAFLEGVEPYVVRQFDGVRVGFLGLTAPRSASYPTITGPVEAAKRWIPEARKHCDILIAVTHIGVDLDKMLASQTTGIDAIVGGDSHTFLYTATEYPNAEGVKIPIVQDGEFGVDLGRFDLNLKKNPDGTWHLSSYKYELLPVGPRIPEAADVKAVLDPYIKPMLDVVGHIGTIASTPADRTKQTVQIVTDALRSEMGADFALSPGDAGFHEVFRHRDVTAYDVYAILPFHDNAATAELTGEQIQGLLKDHPESMTSGDIGAIDPAKTYKIAFLDYIGSGTYKLTASQIVDSGVDVRKVVMSYLGKLR